MTSLAIFETGLFFDFLLLVLISLFLFDGQMFKF